MERDDGLVGRVEVCGGGLYYTGANDSAVWVRFGDKEDQGGGGGRFMPKAQTVTCRQKMKYELMRTFIFS
jgi:hypothetical protein